MMVQACLNGARLPAEHPRLPVTPADLAQDAAACVAAGATALHLHAKDDRGRDTLDPARVGAALAAVRAAVPGTPVGVTTGMWASASPGDRCAAVAAWSDVPDFASVNWHEPGAEQLAAMLLDRGIGLEAGLWSAPAAARWRRWERRDETLRVLLEAFSNSSDGVELAAGLVAEVQGVRVVALLHGEGRTCWPVLEWAVRHRLDTRIGLEDTLSLPDGSPAESNEQLVRAVLG